jgi:chromosome partitioning protein
MQTITAVNQKGGVMKTTLEIHLAAEAIRKGKRAIIVEMDRQGTASKWSSFRAGATDASDLLNPIEASKKPPEVIASNADDLPKLLPKLAQHGYDYVFIDVPGTHSPAVNQVIRISDFVLIPARPTEADIIPSGETLAVVHRFNRPYAYIFTMTVTKARAETFREALEDAGHPVVPGSVGNRVVFQDAIAQGKTVQEIELNGVSASEIKAAWRWLAQQFKSESKHDRRAI